MTKKEIKFLIQDPIDKHLEKYGLDDNEEYQNYHTIMFSMGLLEIWRQNTNIEDRETNADELFMEIDLNENLGMTLEELFKMIDEKIKGEADE